MAYGVALWSFATFLSPWAAARSLWLFISTRVLLGVAEGVALPCMNNMVLRYFFGILFIFKSLDYSSSFCNNLMLSVCDPLPAKIYETLCIGPFPIGGFLAQNDQVLWGLQWLGFSLEIPLDYFFHLLSCHELEFLGHL